MSKKSTEPLEVAVDDLGLSLVGWQVEDVRARLVTESFGKKDHYQKLSVSGTARFLPEDWVDRFSDSDDHDYTPPLLISLQRCEPPLPRAYNELVRETLRKARQQPIRFASSDTWECKRPLTPQELRIDITALDWAEVGYGLEPPKKKSEQLPLQVLDDTNRRSTRMQLTAATAHLLRRAYGKDLHVHIEGTVGFGSAQEFLADHVAVNSWLDANTTLESECPFKVQAPEIEIEVLDDTGFLLGKESISTYGHIPIGENGRLADRAPRWIAQTSTDLDEYAGAPARVVVRIVDSEY